MKYVNYLVHLCLLVFCVGTAIGVLAQETQPAAQPTQQIVREVVVNGYQHVTPEVQQSVSNIINPLVGQPYDAAKATKATESIEALGPFFSARVTQEPVADGLRLVFTVVENPVVSHVRFEGNTVFTDEELKKVISTKPGQVLDQQLATKDANAINQKYASAGYTLASVVDVKIERDPSTGEVTLVFVIFEPTISDIVVKGNTRTREYVIRRQFTPEFQPGKVYNAKAVSATLLNLSQLGIFQDVTATLEPGVTKVGSVRVNINVVERRTGTAGIGLAQNNVEGWTGFINLADTNIFGSGQSLSLGVRFGAEDSYQLSYTNPWVDQRRTSMTVNLYNRTMLREAFNGNGNESIDYDEKRKGGDITFGRPISKDMRTRVNLGLRINDIEATPNDASQEQIDEFSDIFTYSKVRSVSLGANRDTRFPYLKPYQGYYTNLSAEYAGFGGVYFTKLFGEDRRFFTIHKGKQEEGKAPRNWVYATRLMAGTSTGVPPFLDQYMIGGANTLRGYKQDRFPGDNMLLWNHEIRVPVAEPLDIVGFVDLGDAWGGTFAEQYGDANFKLRYSYGAGVRLQTPIGPLRLDYGINDEGGSEFTFGVGSTF